MKSEAKDFATNGYLVLDHVVSEAELLAIEAQLSSVGLDGVGTRNLLSASWCRELAERLRAGSIMATVLPPDPVAVQCTYFEKSADQNWLVALHRDLSIPIKRRIESPGWTAWSEKEGVLFAHPPNAVLESLVAIRVHLEDNTERNSPLQVVPGSHIGGENPTHRIKCLVRRGGALVMRPLLLHASSKLEEGSRRVLHFLFGPRRLPDSAEWAHAV